MQSCIKGSRCSVDPSPIDLWNKAKPSLSTRANLSVFLYELRDIRRMFNILPPKHFNLRSWSDVLKYANGLHLNYNFGWKPFLADVKNTFRGVSTFESRLNKFLQEQDSSIYRHVSKGQVTTAFDESWTLPWNTNFRARVAGTITTTHSAGFRFSYHSPYDRGELNWRGMLDTLGLHVNPSNIWAVLPWSFVVDWFVDVGGALDTLSSDWSEPSVNIHTAYTSSQWTYEGTLTLIPQGVFSGSPSIVGTIHGREYSRTVGMPRYNLVTPDLNADKIRLLASLVGSRF